jgi:hypothetical protein
MRYGILMSPEQSSEASDDITDETVSGSSAWLARLDYVVGKACDALVKNVEDQLREE